MRYARHQKILELINTHEIDTQERLAEKLRQAGFNVTQATVSRDIKELQLVKHAGPSGRSCYTQSRVADAPVSERFRKILRETILSIDSAENIIVIKTLSGCANAAAEQKLGPPGSACRGQMPALPGAARWAIAPYRARRRHRLRQSRQLAQAGTMGYRARSVERMEAAMPERKRSGSTRRIM